MSNIAKVIEVNSTSNNSFDDAVNAGIARACKTVEDVRGAWINEQTVVVEKGKVKEYRVNMKITFVMKD